MSDNFSVELIKELAKQLESVYGFAQSEIMPIILRSISLWSVFDMVSTALWLACAAIFTWACVRQHRKNFLNENDYHLFEKTVGLLTLWIFGFIFLGFIADSIVKNVCYFFHPEVKLIYSLLIRQL